MNHSMNSAPSDQVALELIGSASSHAMSWVVSHRAGEEIKRQTEEEHQGQGQEGQEEWQEECQR